MNTVKIVSPETPKHTILADLCGYNSKKHTAFIGQVGESEPHEVFIITWSNICLAREPHTSWTSDNCPVIVERFVNLEITVKETEQ